MSSELLKPVQVLNYHPLIHKVYWVVFSALIFAELVIIRLNIYAIMQGTWIEAVVKIVVLSTVILSIFFRLFVFVHPRVFSKYKLYEDRIEIYFKKQKKEILFNHIESLKFSILPPRFFGGFSIKLNTGQRFTFLSILNGSHQVLDRILKVKPELVKDSKLKAYVLRSEFIGASWGRIRKKAKNWQRLLVKYLVWPTILSFVLFLTKDYFADASSKFTQFLIIFSFVYVFTFIQSFIFNIIEEKVVIEKYIKYKEHPAIITKSEEQIELLTTVVFYLSQASLVILLAVI